MSLVERALKKLQESRGTTPGSPASAADTTQRTQSAAVPRPAAEAPARSQRIVQIDRVALRAAELLPPESEERQLRHQFRQVKRPLVVNALGRGREAMANGHVILVASALPGDGKTFTALNLAFSMALEEDASVLLVDADVAKRHISRMLGVADEPGLLDLLRDDNADVESMIMNTSEPGLMVLPAGRPTETATELLASARMEAIVKQLGARDPNRIVVLDSPPLLLTSESRALAAVVGQVVLVVRADSTPQQAVFESIELLGEGRSVGLLLNQTTDPARRGYYQHYGEEEAKSEAQ